MEVPHVRSFQSLQRSSLDPRRLGTSRGILAGCATNPATGSKQISLVSSGQELEMGRQADPAIIAEYGLYQDRISRPTSTRWDNRWEGSRIFRI
jgi:predicted Zn-dependent protease